jgi:glucokinase
MTARIEEVQVERFRNVGIDIGGTAIKIAIVWNDGQVARSRQIPTLVEAGPQAAIGRALDCVHGLLREEGADATALRAVGVDSAGIIDHERKLVLDAPNLRAWERHPLAAAIGAALGLPVFLENDVNAMAWGEFRCGAGRGVRHLLCLTLGTGVGGALVLDGRLYRGANGAAGEFGHVTLDRHGPRCACGSTGCLERFVGTAGILERALELLGRDQRPSRLRAVPAADLTPLAIAQAATRGDAVAAEVLEETGRWLGTGLASLANALDPERIVIGGGVARAGEAILGPARRTLRERAMSIPGSRVEVVPAQLGNDAAVVGAALLAVEHVLQS